jgi:hypothetical protein
MDGDRLIASSTTLASLELNLGEAGEDPEQVLSGESQRVIPFSVESLTS